MMSYIKSRLENGSDPINIKVYQADSSTTIMTHFLFLLINQIQICQKQSCPFAVLKLTHLKNAGMRPKLCAHLFNMQAKEF